MSVLFIQGELFTSSLYGIYEELSAKPIRSQGEKFCKVCSTAVSP